MTATRLVQAYYSDLGRLRMLGGDAALDLANTTHWRDGRIIDFIPDYAALLAWSVPAKLLTALEAKSLHAQSKTQAEEGSEIVTAWLKMRAQFRVHLELITTKSAHEDQAARSEQQLRSWGQNITKQFGPLSPLAITGEFSTAPADLPLSLPLLRSYNAIANLLLFTPHEQIRQCEGDPCGGFFIDNSRSKPRRWCAMDACGNRAKVHRHRELRLT